MSFAIAARRRGFERFLAVFSAFAVLMSLMVVFAPAALAHHPEIDATDRCDDTGLLQVEITASSWTNTASSAGNHDDVRVEVLLPGSSSWTQVGSGAFTPAAPYRSFTVNLNGNTVIDPSDLPATTLGSLEGQTIGIRSQVVDTNGGSAGVGWYNDSNQYNTASSGNGNQNASMTLALDDCADSVEVMVTHGDCVVDDGPIKGYVNVTIDPTSGATVQVTGPGGPYNFSGSGGQQSLDPGNYSWTATAESGYELTGTTSGNFTVDPCTSSVIVSHDSCTVDGQAIPGSVTVTIDPTSGATVQVTGPGGPYNFSGSGGSQSLAPGNYSWTASAATGFELTGTTSGDFTVLPCDATVTVEEGECVLGDEGPEGEVEITIDPASGASVQIYDSGDSPVGSAITSSTTVSLVPGDYSWEATPGANFAIEGEDSGEFTIEPCPVVTDGSANACEFDESGNAVGEVEVSIDPAMGATIDIYDGPNPNSDTKVASFTESGSADLPPGTYYWFVTPANGFYHDAEVDSGSFTIDPCDSTVSVSTNGVCILGEDPYGIIQFTVSEGAGVQLYDSNMTPYGPVHTTNGQVQVPPGDYYWEAVLDQGVVVEGPTEGGPLTIEPCEATVQIEKACIVNPLTNIGEGLFGVIMSEGVAKVEVFDGATKVETFTESGVVVVPADKTYTWTAMAEEGFVMAEGSASGSELILGCTPQVTPVTPSASVTVTGSCVLDETTGVGSAVMNVTVTGTVSKVEILDGGSVVATVTESGQVVLPEGKTYTWVTTAAEGWDLSPGSDGGTLVIDTCSDEVEDIEILPYTGIEGDVMLAASVVLLGLGLAVINLARRREEG